MTSEIIFSFFKLRKRVLHLVTTRNICHLCNEVNLRLFLTFFLRACWPSCPNASTGWTCTTALHTLERVLGRRQVQPGRTSSTSSMNSWVSGPEWLIIGNVHIFCQHCQLLTLGRHAVLIFPKCLHQILLLSFTLHSLLFPSSVLHKLLPPFSYFPLCHIWSSQLVTAFTWHLYVIICDKGEQRETKTKCLLYSFTICHALHLGHILLWDQYVHIMKHWAAYLMKW